ncbi:MAG: cupin domain-containing protein [Nitrobacter sp.]
MTGLKALSLSRHDPRPVALAMLMGLACAFALGKTLTLAMNATATLVAPLCASIGSSDPSQNRVDVVASYPLLNVPGKRVTIVRVIYGPGGFTPPHRHAGTVTAYITKGEISSQLGGGPLETFTVGQSFYEPPGSTHVVSANASNTAPAELIAVFVADEGAQLTTMLD